MDFDMERIAGLLISLLEEQENVKIDWSFGSAEGDGEKETDKRLDE